MSLIARDISQQGLLYTTGDFPSLKLYRRTRDILSNIYSERGFAPYQQAYRPFNFQKVNLVVDVGSSEMYTPGVPYGRKFQNGIPDTGTSAHIFDSMSATRSSAITESYNKAVSKLGDLLRGNTDLSIDLAQASKTLRIGRDVAKVIHSVASMRNPIQLLKAAGSARLTWVYGIKPTLQSIYDAVEFQSKHYNREFAFIKARATDVRRSDKNIFGLQWPDYTYTNRWDGFVSARTELGVIMRIPDNPLTQTARLTSLNPVSIAWELIPFSFVFDWFINVGGYVRDLETAITYNSYFSRGYKTVTTLTIYDIGAVRDFRDGNIVYKGHWGYRVTRRSLNRVGLTSYPYPSRPRFNTNLGSGRLLNAASLLTNLLSRKR